MTTEEISFPDTPRSELERTIEELVERAQRVLSTEERLRSLLHANRVVAEELALDEVLRRIAEAAVELVGARYGALGVIGRGGLLEQFIHVGMPESDADRIGNLPEGHGLLRAVIDTGAPIRLDHLGDDPRSVGFPAHHPRMDAFLGVPIRVRGAVFGNLYLTDPRSGRFTREDEDLVSVLAAAAGGAIENARLFDEAQRRQRWSEALADIAAALLSGDSGDPLAVVVERVAALAEADLACVAVPADDGEGMRIAAVHGVGAHRLRDRVVATSATGSGRSLADDAPLLLDGAHAAALFDGEIEVGPTFIVPLEAFGTRIGVLAVSRAPGSMPFLDTDLRLATEFAAQASVALEFARGRIDRQRLELVEDRSRIARDLHDHVIQRLFGAGLGLQSAASRAPEAIRTTILEQVEAIDAAISEIRTVVFALTAPATEHGPSLRHRLLDIAAEAGDGVESAPQLSFEGAIDVLVRGELADDVAAVVRESLTNVARHAQATSARITVAVQDQRVRVQVDDDGRGFHPGDHAGGTANLATRAARRGGECSIETRAEGGTRVTWTVPLEATA